MGVKQKPTQSASSNGMNATNDRDREREKKKRVAENNVGKEFQTVNGITIMTKSKSNLLMLL